MAGYQYIIGTVSAGIQRISTESQISIETQQQKTLSEDPEYLKFLEFKQKIAQLDYKYFEKTYPELSTLLRIISDYYYREGLSMSQEALNELKGKFDKLREGVARGHAVLGGAVSGLVALGVVSVGIGSIIGLALGLVGSLIEPIKAINTSKERMDDLGNRLRKFSNSLHEWKPYNLNDPALELKRNIWGKGLELLHSRPKCRSASGGCAKEHIQKAVQVDLFNKAYEIILKIYNDLTFEKWMEDKRYKEVKSVEKQQDIAKTEIKMEAGEKVSNGLLILILVIIILLVK